MGQYGTEALPDQVCTAITVSSPPLVSSISCPMFRDAFLPRTVPFWPPTRFQETEHYKALS